MDITKLLKVFLLMCCAFLPGTYAEELIFRNTTECGSIGLRLVESQVVVGYRNLTEIVLQFGSDGQMMCKVEIRSTYPLAVMLAEPSSSEIEFKDKISLSPNTRGVVTFFARGDGVGISKLTYRIKTPQEEYLPGEVSLEAIVARQPSVLITAFTYFVGVMAIFNMFVLGCRSNLVKMREYIHKNKKAVTLGVFCPMFFLPLVAMAFILGFTYGLEGSVNALHPMESIMLVTVAALPGGGLAAPWIKLTGACMVLDYSSTLIITLLSLGSTPLLCFLLGLIWHPIPFLQMYATHIAVWHTILIAAYTLGVILRYFNLKGVLRMVKFFLIPLSICFVLAFLIFGFYSNVYVFFIRRGWLALSAMLFTWFAYFFGFITAVIFRLPWHQIKTITMNSGVCQPVLAMAIFRWTFPNPEADIGQYITFIVFVAAPIPLILTSLIVVGIRFFSSVTKKEDKEKCLPTENGKTEQHNGHENLGMDEIAKDESVSETEVNLELHSAATDVIEDQDDPGQAID